MPGQLDAVASIVSKLGALVQKDHDLLITHGNASQIGYMMLRGEVARHVVHPLPLDICSADTQGATGYMLQQALTNWLEKQNVEKEVATVVTQVVVGDPMPPGAPKTKGVGPFFDWERAKSLKFDRGWDFTMVPGLGAQRIVPCLMPEQIVESKSISCLMESGFIIICAGGGGVAVRKDDECGFVGIDAVVDKACTAALLAKQIDADKIIFVTTRERIESLHNFNNGIDFHHLSLLDLNALIEQELNIKDTMRYKLIASQGYLRDGGKSVLFVSHDQLGEIPNPSVGLEISN
jgi:carbamate kinase